MTDQQKKKIFNSITEISDQYVEEAAEESAETVYAAEEKPDTMKAGKKRLTVKMVFGLAAALAVAAAGILFFTKILPETRKFKPDLHTSDISERPTKTVQEKDGQGGEKTGDQNLPTRIAEPPVPGGEMAYAKHWEEKTADEKYTSLDFDGRTYQNRASRVPEERLGEAAGTNLEAYGYDSYAEINGTEEVKRIAAEAREIKGVPAKTALAVRLEGEDHYTPFVAEFSFSKENRPDTLGGLLSDLNLEEDLRIGTIYAYQNIEPPVIALCFEGADRAEVFRKLLYKTDLPRIEELPKDVTKILYSISIYDDVLGIENLALSVYEGGYLWTNLTGAASIFYIGEEDSLAFFEYMKSELECYALVFEPGEGVPEAYTEVPNLEHEEPLETVVNTSNPGK